MFDFLTNFNVLKTKLMNISRLILAFLLLVSLTNCKKGNEESVPEKKSAIENKDFYQLKIFSCNSNEQVQITDQYLQNAYLPEIKKSGFSNIGAFKPKTIETDSIKKIFLLIPFKSFDDFYNLEQKLSGSEAYILNSHNFLEAPYDNPPFSRYESIILKSFKDFPTLKTPSFESQRVERVYELRSYESPTDNFFKNKVDMFNDGGEIKLFDRLEFNAVFYGEVISGPKMPNLMYMTTFSDQASRDEHWKAFVDSPEWKKLSSLSKYKNNVSHIDINFLYPTEYSDY